MAPERFEKWGGGDIRDWEPDLMDPHKDLDQLGKMAEKVGVGVGTF